MKALLILITLILSATAWTSILPPNDLHLEDNMFSEDANIDQTLFNQIIESTVAFYTDIVAQHGGVLVMDKRWDSSQVNAFASRRGNSWRVEMHGGLARRPEVTPDGFALVVCHELGHHLAGYAFKFSGWAASEGQSDYFASHSCARRIWGADIEGNKAARDSVHPTAKAKCDAAVSTQAEKNLCYRTALAGESLATLLAALGDESAISFDTPDQKKVRRTNVHHPAGQCRLDTYLAGALCTKSFDPNVIPGASIRRNTVEAEKESSKYTCTAATGESIGLRPACWFKPLISSEFILQLAAHNHKH